MIPYILYVALLLTACFVFYKLLLQKETFFYLNRFVLLACMMLAFILPLLPVPQQWSLRKTEAPVTMTYKDPVVYANNITPTIKENNQTPVIKSSQEKQTITFEQVINWIFYLYWFGVVIFGLNLLMQAAILLYNAYSSPAIKDGKFRIIEITGDKAPFHLATTFLLILKNMISKRTTRYSCTKKFILSKSIRLIFCLQRSF